MIGKIVRQASLFAFAFFKEAAAIKEPMLDSIDRLLEDPQLLALSTLKHYLPLVEQVITQSEARIFQADTRHPDKILSLFEPHSVVIRKGKAHRPNEFGRLVRIDEVENGLVSNYFVAPGNLCDQQQ